MSSNYNLQIMDTVTIILGVVAVVAIVALVVVLVMRSRREGAIKYVCEAEKGQLTLEYQAKLQQLEMQLEGQRNEAELQYDNLRNEAQMKLDAQRRESELQLNAERKMAEAQVKAEQERYAELERSQAELRKSEKEAHERMYKEQEAQFNKSIASMKAEFEKLANDILERKSQGMQQVNKESLDKLLLPLRENLTNFKNEVELTKKSGIETSSKMEQVIRNLMEQTQKLGTDANNLAEALKSKPKMQGNWGEAILKDILADSGLREGDEFVLQESVTDDEGNRIIPDVVVKFSDKGNVIIDSKVSLTAYAEYMNSNDESERSRYLSQHLDSVRQHVKELSAKSYASHIKDSVGMVLMFIPNEGAYILAMQQDSKLFTDAYRAKVIIVNPTNLMLSLNIIYSIWQSRRQEKNVEKIIQSATTLYEKFAVFSKTFADMRSKIDALNKVYDEADKQLTTGRGNIVKQLTEFKSLGVMPKKEIAIEGERD